VSRAFRAAGNAHADEMNFLPALRKPIDGAHLFASPSFQKVLVPAVDDHVVRF
jgi:hypothetical protein